MQWRRIETNYTVFMKILKQRTLMCTLGTGVIWEGVILPKTLLRSFFRQRTLDILEEKRCKKAKNVNSYC